MRTIQVTSRKLVVVEGKDDERFFSALLRQIGLTDVQCIGLGGKDEMGKTETWRAVVATPGFAELEALAIVRDADDNPQGAFQSVKDTLRNVGLSPPSAPFRIQQGTPKVCVIILPDVGSKGELEDLCLQSLAGEPVMECVEQFWECVQQREKHPPRKVSKAKLHAYLSCRREPGRRLGEAAEAGDIPLGSQAFDRVKQALRDLFA
ncbi:MAG: DUF3226 domain-containing protein [Armatimonadota bacterium]